MIAQREGEITTPAYTAGIRAGDCVRCKEIHIDKPSGSETMWLMHRDDITEAFARWKMAQDAFLATEQRLFDAVGTGAPQSPVKYIHKSDPRFVEVRTKRAEAEELLLFAMKLLHERRHPPGAPPPSPA